MAKINDLLTQRFKSAGEKLSKMTNLAELSSSGNLSSFAGVFKIAPLTLQEEEALKTLLTEYSESDLSEEDFLLLSSLTSEVKAINNQAILLHGERIKKARDLLKSYKEGAFTAWLMATYGNRQTPYNFLQYFELYTELSPLLLPKLDEIPKQAVYALASREGPFEKKQEIIKNYKGEPKQEFLALIRREFPLNLQDKRAKDLSGFAIRALSKLLSHLQEGPFNPSPHQKKSLKELLNSLESLL